MCSLKLLCGILVWYGSRQHLVRCAVVWWPSLLVCLCVCVTENDRSARHNTIRNDIQRRDPLNIACSRCSMVYMLFRGMVSYVWCGQILCFGLVFSNRAVLYGVVYPMTKQRCPLQEWTHLDMGVARSNLDGRAFFQNDENAGAKKANLWFCL